MVTRYTVVAFFVYLVSTSMLMGYFRWKLPLMVLDLYTLYVSSLLFTFTNIVDILASFFGGVLADSYGRRLVLVVNSLILFACVALFAMFVSSRNPVLIVVSLVLLMGLSSIGFPALNALAVELVKEKHLGKFISLARLSSRLGNAVGSSILEVLSYRVLVMLVCCLASLLSLAFIRDERKSLSYSKGRRSITACASLGGVLKRITLFAELAKDKVFVKLAMVVSLNSLAHAVIGYYIPDYLEEYVGATTSIIALSYTLLYIGQAIAIIVAGYIADVRNAILLLIVGNIFAGLALLTALTVAGIYAVAAVTAFGVLASFHGIGLSVVIARMFGRDVVGTMYGFVEALGSTMFIVGPFIGGLVYGSFPQLLVGFTASLLILCGIIALRLYPTLHISAQKGTPK